MSIGLSKLALIAGTYTLPFAGWSIILYIVMHLLKVLKKKKKDDLKTRMAREFGLANREIYPLLDTKEKEEMLKVLKTTIKNAQLFSNKNSAENEKGLSPRRSNKKIHKKVCFELPPQRSQ